MAADPTIRAALEAAEREPTTAGKIAAFLRALPDGEVLRLLAHETDKHRGWRDTLAAAVEEAARHG